MSTTKPGRRHRATRGPTPDRTPVRVNIVRLIPGTTRLPVGADPDVERAFRA